MSVTVTGQPLAAIGPIRRRTITNKQGGTSIEWTFRGTEEHMRTVHAQLVAAGWDDVSIDKSGPICEVTARTSDPSQETGEPEVEQVEVRLEAHRVAKDIFEHAAFAALSSSLISQLRKSLTDGTDLTGQIPPGEANAAELYGLALKGVEHFTVYHQTLIVNRVASSSYVFEVSYANIGRLIATSRLAQEANVAGLLRFALPAETSPKAGFSYSWVKHYPSYGPAGGRYALVQEYEYGLWNVTMYGGTVLT